MELEMPTDLVDDRQAIPSMLVKNVSAREYVDVVGAVVYKFKPGETKTIEEHQDVKRDDFGKPLIKRKSSARGPDGQRLTNAVELVTAKGGKLDEIWAYLNKKKGNPLVRLRGDGKDKAREDWKLKAHSAHAMREAQYQIAQWMKRCADNRANGLPVEDKPHYIFDAEMDFLLFSKNTDEKRFKVTLDGSRFNTKEECEQHIKTSPFLAQYVDTWKSYVEDLKGGDILVAANPNVVAAIPAPAGATNAAVLGVLKMAEKAKKTIPAEIVSRLATDPDAMTEAMDFIMADEEGDEDPDEKPPARLPGETKKAYRERIAVSSSPAKAE